ALAPLLVLLVAAPGALAQSGARMAPPSEPIVPGGPPAKIPITVDVACGPDAAPNGIHVQYFVTRAPAWAQVTVSPDRDQMAYSQCASAGSATFRSLASVTVTQDAPAFMPDQIEVTIRVTG